MDTMHIGRTIRAARQRAGLSLRDLNKLTGIHHGNLHRIEGRERGITLATLTRIAEALKLPVETFLLPPTILRTTTDMGMHTLPLMTYAQAFAEQSMNTSLQNLPKVSVNRSYSEEAFVTYVEGQDNLPRFKPGDGIVIDPVIQPRPNDMVLAVVTPYGPVFRQYKERGEAIFELVALNDGYASSRSDRSEITIRGTMVEHSQYRDL